MGKSFLLADCPGLLVGAVRLGMQSVRLITDPIVDSAVALLGRTTTSASTGFTFTDSLQTLYSTASLSSIPDQLMAFLDRPDVATYSRTVFEIVEQIPKVYHTTLEDVTTSKSIRARFVCALAGYAAVASWLGFFAWAQKNAPRPFWLGQLAQQNVVYVKVSPYGRTCVASLQAKLIMP